MEKFLQLAINGLLLGSFYATMALGFATIWGVMRLINLAHGEFLLMGAFVAWFFFNPTREQNLIIGSNDPTVTLVVFLLIAIIIGFILAEFLLNRRTAKTTWPQRAVGLVISGLAAFAFYALWSANGFQDIEITMMAIIMVSMALSLGFITSHIILGTILEMNNIWRQRSIGYSIGIGIVAIGYVLWRSSNYSPIDPFVSIVLLFPLFFAFGYVLQRSLLNRLVEGPYLTMLLVTFAISIILQNIGLQIYAADPRRINVDYGTAITIGPTLTIPPTKLITMGISLLMIAGLVAFLQWTRVGYAIRAAAQNKMAARLMGINIYETYAITFGISIALTAIAGGMMGTFQPITPVTGPPWTIRAFSIVALGGLGRVRGVVAGGMVLGMAESYIAGYIDVGWAIAAAFILLVVMLITRPQGITGGLAPAEE